jgi:hypothetical protein
MSLRERLARKPPKASLATPFRPARLRQADVTGIADE